MTKTNSSIVIGVVCRLCGRERLQRPWDVIDGYRCHNCGTVNWPPLLEQEIET